ncbi:MAG: heavy metal translocating P-type ATPase, partial [Spirochaetia bacterium]|nr:heavy metal translocating P-type ATPase [Spirochaetia bacterium]
MEQYIVTGMSCAACQARVEKAVSKVPGVESCAVSLLTNSMGVEGTASADEIIKAVEKAGYGARPKGSSEGKQVKGSGRDLLNVTPKTDPINSDEDALSDHETPVLKRRLILSAFFLLVLMYITMGHHMLHLPLPSFLHHNYIALAIIQMFLALIVMCINRKFFTSGFGSLVHGAPNMDTLVAMGSEVSFLWSLAVLFQMTSLITAGNPNSTLQELYHKQLYFESAAMIPALITVGKMLEAMSKGRTTNALKSLMRLSPKTAVLLKDGVEVEVGIEEVKIGDIFVVRPGMSIPVDGIVLEGESAVNEAALTGESIPADKTAGSRVSAATINQSGYIKCQATRVGEDTTLSQIIKMVSDAAATKAPIARIADKVSGVFVPAVIAIAAVVTAGWVLAGETWSF